MKSQMNKKVVAMSNTPLMQPSEEVERLAHEVVGAALEVHRALGPGFLEPVYEEAMRVELGLRNIPVTYEETVEVDYKGHKVGRGRLDLRVGRDLIVELKAVAALLPIHTAQLLSYLKATGCILGLLINFNTVVLRDGIKRVILSKQQNP